MLSVNRENPPEALEFSEGPDTSPPPAGADSPSRLGKLRYLFFGRLLPAFFFALFGLFDLGRPLSDFRALGPHPSLQQVLVGPVHSGLYLAFICVPIFIYIDRPPPRARDGSIIARVLAFVGTFMLLVFPRLFNGGPTFDPPAWLRFAAGILLILSTALALWGISYLRMSFSIIPEARQLVRRGPYRLVRHPLYVGEIGAALSLVLQSKVGLWSTGVLVVFITVQLGRTVFEERLLRSHFPEYDDYARSTTRLIPFIL